MSDWEYSLLTRSYVWQLGERCVVCDVIDSDRERCGRKTPIWIIFFAARLELCAFVVRNYVCWSNTRWLAPLQCFKLAPQFSRQSKCQGTNVIITVKWAEPFGRKARRLCRRRCIYAWFYSALTPELWNICFLHNERFGSNTTLYSAAFSSLLPKY